MLSSDSYRLVLDNISDGVYVLDGARKIIYWNKGAEKVSGFSAAEVVGKSCSDNILTHIDCSGKCLCTGHCPAMQTLLDGQPREADIFLHHKDGYRVPVHVSLNPLRNDKGEIVGAVEIFREDHSRAGARAAMQSLKRQLMTDIPTGLPNRRFLEVRLQSRLEDMRRYGWPFGVVLAEIDHWADVQAEAGPQVNPLLKMVGASVANATRSADTVGRWGDCQFLGILANAGVEQVELVAERARMLVEASYLQNGHGLLRATVSIGATAVERGDSAANLLRRAEICLFHSRSSGRNRVTIHEG